MNGDTKSKRFNSFLTNDQQMLVALLCYVLSIPLGLVFSIMVTHYTNLSIGIITGLSVFVMFTGIFLYSYVLWRSRHRDEQGAHH